MAKKTLTIKTCECIEVCDKELAKHNATLKTSLQMNFKTGESRAVMGLPLEKIDAKKKKPLPFFAMAYCPICGKANFSDAK